MRHTVNILLAVFFASLVLVMPLMGETLYFPHYADGGGWVMEIYLSNLGDETATGTIKIFDSLGNPQALSFTTGTESSIDLTLGPNETFTASSTGSGSIKTGYIVVDTDQKIIGSVLFRYFNGTEVSVPSSVPGRKFILPIETSDLIDVGLAVAFQGSDAPISLKLFDSTGGMRLNRSWEIGQKHIARFITELAGKLSDFSGFLVLESEYDFSCFGVRFWTTVSSMSALPLFDPRNIMDPELVITSPTSASEYITNEQFIDIKGTAFSRAGISSISWSINGQPKGSISPSSAWTKNNIQLVPGLNKISFTISNMLGNTSSDVLDVIYVADTNAPSIQISIPTTQPSYPTSSNTVSIGGSSSDDIGVVKVDWANDRGGSGTANGTTSWTASVPLQIGANVITVTAYDAAGNHSSDTITVTYTPPDTGQPTIEINQPTTNPAFSTNSSPIGIGGTASDNVGLSSVSWANDRGGSGTANGTTSWTASVPLQTGANVITVTAYDAAGNHGSDMITVTYTPADSTAPTLTTTIPGPSLFTRHGLLFMKGTSFDNVGVASVSWENSRGGVGTADGTTGWSIDDIPLLSGSNTITVTASDAAGNWKSEVVSVNYEHVNTAYQLYGINFSPYIGAQNPNFNPQIPELQIYERLCLIAPYVSTWVRTFGMTNGLEKSGNLIHKFGLKAALGVWIGSNTTANETEMANAIAAANAGDADMVIVGSEVVLRGDVSESQLIDYINRMRAAVPPGIPVTSADVYGMLLNHPNVVTACDSAMANIYPYWEGINELYAIAALNTVYETLRTAFPGKPAIVSETGWPSAGDTRVEAVPSEANAAAYFINFVSWARSKSVEYFYFEALNEPWKAFYEGPQGSNWGIMYEDGTLKPGMQDVFNGMTVPDNWTGNDLIGGPGTPEMSVTTVPAYGSFHPLKGAINHLRPNEYRIAVYLCLYEFGTNWWTKPYELSPTTIINPDGTWSCNVTAGGSDQYAIRYRVYLIPKDYVPPIALNYDISPDIELHALARIDITRTPFQ